MQHWQVYIEWNEKLSTEIVQDVQGDALIRIRPSTGTKARSSSSTFNNSPGKKLKDLWCLSDEYLNYAKKIATSGKERER
jgi:hypothetical protein